MRTTTVVEISFSCDPHQDVAAGAADENASDTKPPSEGSAAAEAKADELDWYTSLDALKSFSYLDEAIRKVSRVQ